MFKNKIILSLFIFLVLVIAGLSYFLYGSYREVIKNRELKNIQENTANVSKSNVPPGTEIPLIKADQPKDNSLSVTTDANGTQVPANSMNSAVPVNPNSENGGQPTDNAQTNLSDTSNWKIYTNKKYDYSFKYPQQFDFSSCDKNSPPCKYGQTYEKDGGDFAWVNGSLTNRGWPYIIVTHVDNESYTLPKNVKFFDWLKQKFGWTTDKDPKDFNFELVNAKGDPKKAMLISVPQTPQAYAREEVYFEKNNKIFQIQLLDSNKPEAQQFYSAWLKTFTLL